MKGINNKPFVCLDQYLDIESLLELVDDIHYGIAISHKDIRINFASTYHRFNTDIKLEDPKDFSSGYHCWLNDAERQSIGKELLETDTKAFQYWLTLQYRIVEPLQYVILREPDKKFDETYIPLDGMKNNSIDFFWTDESKNFSTLKTWCEKLPFDKLGSVSLLLMMPGSPMPMHRDLFYIDDNYEHQESFIWFDPLKSRSMYVLDKNTEEKYFMKGGISYIWNNHDWHGGVEPTSNLTWTLRVEGIFSEDFKKKVYGS